MAYISLKDCGHIFLGPRSVGPVVGGYSLKVSSVVDQRRFAGGAFQVNLDTGAAQGEVALSGVIYDSATNIAFAPLPATAYPVSLCLEGDTLQTNFWGFESAKVTAAEVSADPSKMNDVVPEISVMGKVHQGIVTAPYATRTTAGNTDTTYMNIGAAGTRAAVGFLHVDAIVLGAASSATVAIRHCATAGGTYVAYGTFTNVTAATSEVISMAALERYVSVSWAYNGGAGTSISFFVGVAID